MFSCLPAYLGVQIKQCDKTWKTSDAYISPKGPSRTIIQERTKKEGSRMDMFSPSGIESCGSEPAEAKKIHQ